MSEAAIVVAPAPYYLLVHADKITGISVGAMRKKIERGQWLAGREYIKAPDGNLYLSLKGYTAWVESARPA
jgi:hypothetical protein